MKKALGTACALVFIMAAIALPARLHARSSNGMVGGDVISADNPIVSDDGRFALLYQDDGNLVLYGPDGAMWSSGSVGTSVGFTTLQGDGNFVVYDGGGAPVWSSGTAGNPGAFLYVQNDGNLVIYDASGMPLWASGTAGH